VEGRGKSEKDKIDTRRTSRGMKKKNVNLG
jgi:hypothetical protein